MFFSDTIMLMAGERVLVGIPPDEVINKNTGRLNYGQTDEYSEAVWQAGGEPYTLHSTDRPERVSAYYDRVDAILFGGGLDVNPPLYGGVEDLPAANNGSIKNDLMALQLLKLALSRENPKPFLAICRGMQLLNIALDGTLHQHLPDLSRDHPIDHKSAHPIEIMGGTLLAELLHGTDTIEVGSRHHQAIRKLGSGLIVAAMSPDEVIEAVVLDDPKRFGVGVQWHEEEEGTTRLFDPFIEAAIEAKYGVRHLEAA